MFARGFQFLVGLSALASTSGALAEDEFTLPPFEPHYEPQGTDERGLWMEADEGERSFRDSDLIIRDADLNAYVRSVLCRTVGEERCQNVRTYIARVPRFNASMAPNGMMTVWSGLLLRCRNEAELAAVLGHEFGHFERRHTVARFRRQRSATDFLAWSGLGQLYTGTRSFGELLVIGGFFEFNRDQEREADILGLTYLMNSGYRSHAAADVWLHLMDEVDATAEGRSRRSQRYDRTAFFATHPTSRERSEYLTELAGVEVSESDENQDAFDAAMANWIPVFLEDQIRLNDFGGTEYILAQLAERRGWTAELLYFRGELYRTRGNPRDLVNAAELYRQSLALDDTRAAAFRGLGLSMMRGREGDWGREALTQYLTMEPEAADAPMIESLVAAAP